MKYPIATSFSKYEDGVAEIQSNLGSRSRRRRQTPLERGWTSASPKGKQFAHPVSPDPCTDYSGFQSILVQYQMVGHMTGTGRVRLINQMMLTGNGKGLAGFALSKSSTRTGGYSFQKAVNRAGLRLVDITMFDNRTGLYSYTLYCSTVRLPVYRT